MYWNVSVGLKCVLISRTDSLLNLWPLYVVVSKKVASVHDISVVNLIVEWCLFACLMNFSMTSLLVCQREIRQRERDQMLASPKEDPSCVNLNG